MSPRALALVGLGLLLAAVPATTALHAPNGAFTRDSGTYSFYVPFATAVWWHHRYISPLGATTLDTGLEEETHTIEIDSRVTGSTAPVFVEAETFPVNGDDTPKVCDLPAVPAVQAPTVVVHGGTCQKYNGYSVQIHYFPWTTDPGDPDHVVSPTASNPAATAVWEVDAIPTSYKKAQLNPGRWQVWIDPAVAIGEYTVVYRAYSAQPFYFDYLGTRGCVFYSSLGDQDLLGCPDGYI